MKIRRLNENITIGNPFKEIENLDDQIKNLENQITIIRKELKSITEKIFPILMKYLILRPELKEDEDIIIDKYTGSIEIVRLVDINKPYYSKFAPKDAIYEIVYLPNESTEDDGLESAWLTKADVEDFLVFLADQKMWKDAKKYNL